MESRWIQNPAAFFLAALFFHLHPSVTTGPGSPFRPSRPRSCSPQRRQGLGTDFASHDRDPVAFRIHRKPKNLLPFGNFAFFEGLNLIEIKENRKLYVTYIFSPCFIRKPPVARSFSFSRLPRILWRIPSFQERLWGRSTLPLPFCSFGQKLNLIDVLPAFARLSNHWPDQ